MQIFNNFFDYDRFIKTMIYYSIEGPKPKFSIFTPTTTILDTNKKIVNIINDAIIAIIFVNNPKIKKEAIKISTRP